MAIEITNACPEGNVSRPVTLTSPYAPPGQKGNPVIVPEGFFISDVSQEDADAQAEAFARQFLLCGYEHVHMVALPERTYVKDPFGGEKTFRLNLNLEKSKLAKNAVRVPAVYKKDRLIFDDPEDSMTEIELEVPADFVLPDSVRYLADVGASQNTEYTSGVATNTITTGFSTHVWFLRVIGFSPASEEEAENQARSLGALEMPGVYCNALIEKICPDPAGSKDAIAGKFCDESPSFAIQLALAFLYTSQTKKIIGDNCSGIGGGEFPFDIYVDDDEEENERKVTLRPGVCNGVIPQNMFNEFVYTLDPGSIRYFIVRFNSTSGQITSVVLRMDTAPSAPIPTTPNVPPTQFDYTIGVVSSTGIGHNIAQGNLMASPAQHFVVEKASPGPNELPYNIHYSWEVRRDTFVA